MRRHITLVSASAAPSARRLLEHVVANPDTVTAYIDRFVQRTKPEAAQAWLVKRLRAQLSNEASLLQVIPHGEAELLAGVPDYVHRQVAQGGPVYRFVPGATAVGQFSSVVDHLVDWFNALHQTVAAPADNALAIQDRQRAERALAGLGKISFADATRVADAWFRNMGSRVQRDKAGVAIIERWPDGYYAVRYTDLATYKSDGAILQQCLESGTYWRELTAGTMAIFVLRKPNDEPVATVGCDRRGGRLGLSQLKGKNNKPVQPVYSKYLAELLTRLQIVPEPAGQTDLEAAGLSYNAATKTYGDFAQVADLVVNRAGLKVWATARRFLASVHGQRIGGVFAGNQIAGIDHLDAHPPSRDNLLLLLNGLALDPTAEFAETLRGVDGFADIYCNAGKYGVAAAVGTPISVPAGYAMYAVPVQHGPYQSMIRYAVYAAARPGTTPNALIGSVQTMAPSNRIGVDAVITGVSAGLAKLPAADLAALLNALPGQTQPAIEAANVILPVVPSEHGYGLFNAVGVPMLQAAGATIWWIGRVADKPPMLLISNDRPDEFFWLIPPYGRNNPDLVVQPVRGDEHAVALARIAPVVRAYVLANQVTHVENAAAFGMVNVPKGVIADFSSMVRYLDGISDELRAFHSDTRLFAAAKMLFGKTGQKLDADQQQQLYTLFRPTDETPISIWTLNTYQVLDLEVPRYAVFLPLPNVLLWHAGVLTGPALKRAIKADVSRATTALAAHLKAHRTKFALFGFGDRDRDTAPAAIKPPEFYLDDAGKQRMAKLSELMTASNDKTMAALRERKRHPENYDASGDLAARFAAQNVFRKLGI